MTRRAPTLWRILAVRIGVAAALVSVALVGFVFAQYTLDTPALRRATLVADMAQVTAALRAGRDPSTEPQFARYPRNYAYRAFDRDDGRRRILSAANADLLPAWPDDDQDMQAGFFDLERETGASGDQWRLTDREQIGDRLVWVELGMAGDPAWRWGRVVLAELFDHVLVPVAAIVPLLTIATLLVVHRACRQLNVLGAQAEALGEAALRGRPLRPLSDAGLPEELRALVGAINAMLQALARVLAAQREFNADAAHELRTPLAVMALQVAELPRGPATEQLQRELADLGRLVSQLLRMAQAEGAMLAEQRRIDLALLTRKVCEDLAPIALTRRQSLSFDAPDGETALDGNAELIEIAVRNLIENALKATPDAGTVRVRVTPDARVIVDDEGPGVPNASKPMIFRRFWRGEALRGQGPHQGGAGIGLALVRKIADLHGGDIAVRDRAEGGARFVLRLA